MCRSEEKFLTIFNQQADRLIRSLHVFCTNKQQGCDWQGEVHNVNDHLSKCLLQVVSCSNDCEKSLERQYLASHIETECPRRKIECQFCQDTGEYHLIEGRHKDKCPKFPLPCPNKCEIESIERDKIEEHRKTCPLEVIQCDYHAIGCTTKMTRKELSKHKQEMMEEHLSLSIKELVETKAQLKLTATEHQLTVLQLKKTQDELNKKSSASMQQAAVHQVALESHVTQQLAHIKKTTKEELTANAARTKDEIGNKLAVSLTEMKDKLAKITDDSVEKTKELETKLDDLKKMLYDPTIFWYNTLNYRASKLSSHDQVVPVIVKVAEFSKNLQEWCSTPFYLKPKSQNPVQLMVGVKTTSSKDYISVLLVMTAAGQLPRAPLAYLRVLNQISDCEHCTATEQKRPKIQDGDNVQLQKFFIPIDKLTNGTETCRYLDDGIIFLEVLACT